MKQVNNKIVCVLLLLGLHSYVTAQNPAIFKGGTSDGWVSKNYITSSTNIFKGGTSDGWSSINIQQANTNIFKGGTNDGWSSQNYVQNAGGTIFKGGFGDGWDSKNIVQASTVISKGGNGDGWSSINKVQASTAIHKGGFGDGWASTYRPQGPLPITILTFTAQKQGTAALVQWTTSSEINSHYFEVERSNDAINFEYVGRIDAAGNSSREINYSFTDYQPLAGLNYYRLKQVDLDGHYVYSPARLVRFDGLAGGLVRYYPNPTKGIVNIELPPNFQPEAMVINISNSAGVVLDQLKQQPGGGSIIQVNMSRFAKGTYFIQVKTNNSNSVQRIVLF